MTTPAVPAFSLSILPLSKGNVSSLSSASLLLPERDIRFLAGGRMYKLGNGDVFLLLPHTPAYIYPNTEAACGLRIDLSADALRDLSPALLLAAANGGAAFCPRTGEAALLQLATAALLESDVLSLFTLLSVITRGENVTHLRECPLPRSLRRALLLLYEHPDAPADTEALALRCDVSQSTLQRLFRDLVGVTPRVWLRLVKDARAERSPKAK